MSVTTHPGRIDTFRLPLLSLLNQTARAERVVVSLLEHEFPGRVLPSWLRRLAQGGHVEILWAAGEIRSYAKLFPAISAHPDCTIVTADDDVLYPRSWLAGLLRCADQCPGAIVGYRARPAIKRDGVLLPYAEWSPDALKDLDLSNVTAADVMLTGVGGVLYPPGALPAVAQDMGLARSLCPTADDVWLWAIELMAESRLALIPPGYRDFTAAAGSQGQGRLMSMNVEGGANDAQIRAVLNHFGLWQSLGMTPPG